MIIFMIYIKSADDLFWVIVLSFYVLNSENSHHKFPKIQVTCLKLLVDLDKI